MIRLIKYNFLYIFLWIFSINLSSAFPEEHIIVLDNQNLSTSKILEDALEISAIRILGSKSEFDQNKRYVEKLSAEKFIKSYEFINMNKVKIIVNAKLLRNKFLENNLSISSEERQTMTAWVLCKTNFNSKNEYDFLRKKCEFVKQDLLNMASKRGMNLIFPILDTNDVSFLDLEQNDERSFDSFINNRYGSDESFYCEITKKEQNCFKTESSKNKKINFSKVYSPKNIFNLTADSIQKKEKILINKNNYKPFSIHISNINSIEEYDYVFKELEQIIYFNELSLYKLENKDVIFKSNLLGKLIQVKKILFNKKDFKITSSDYEKIILEFKPKKNVEDNT